jgi:hypothetical protein
MEEAIREMKSNRYAKERKGLKRRERKEKVNENETEGDRKKRGIVCDAVGSRGDNRRWMWLPVSKGLITPLQAISF